MEPSRDRHDCAICNGIHNYESWTVLLNGNPMHAECYERRQRKLIEYEYELLLDLAILLDGEPDLGMDSLWE